MRLFFGKFLKAGRGNDRGVLEEMPIEEGWEEDEQRRKKGWGSMAHG